jgi:hypothetical protein
VARKRERKRRGGRNGQCSKTGVLLRKLLKVGFGLIKVSVVAVGSHPGRRTMGPTGGTGGTGIRLAWLLSADGSWPGVGTGSGPAVHVGLITR